VKTASAPALRQDILVARGVTKTYRTGAVEIQALRGIDLEFHPRELVVLLGPSGSGKSTLLNLLGGLDRASRGQILFGEADLATLDDRALTRYRRETIGFVFQSYNLLPSLTARENVALVTEDAPQALAPEAALELVGLFDRKDHFPAELSGGEQQRVAVARAIARRPPVLLCDEPTGALDSKTGVVVLEAIDRINRDFGTFAILVTHNVAIAEMADRVVAIADGAITSVRSNTHRCPASTLSW